ncbi:hypothetical protein G5C60_29825 [Streptomyces sp. HC44]|uniref:Uncharacterized protein n=1 Tax=Streptomyces scabichelini TaxID=2711217 RepID=A0A6G4VC30_9ACTN|nr:hypothetical protein [Streptomyces scabichelini]NGO11682.1 hypothetical protein [Streptomyces scabichelini]
MLNSKKIAAAVAAGVLGSFALMGAGSGAVQAFAGDGSGRCVDDGNGQVRCEYVKKRHLVTDTLEYLGIGNKSTQD